MMYSIIYPQIHILPVRVIFLLPTWGKWTISAALLTASTHFYFTKSWSRAFCCDATCHALWRYRLLSLYWYIKFWDLKCKKKNVRLKCRLWMLRILGSNGNLRQNYGLTFWATWQEYFWWGLGCQGGKPNCWRWLPLLRPHLHHWSICCIWWFALYCRWVMVGAWWLFHVFGHGKLIVSLRLVVFVYTS